MTLARIRFPIELKACIDSILSGSAPTSNLRLQGQNMASFSLLAIPGPLRQRLPKGHLA
jgi:hypothetical protein